MLQDNLEYISFTVDEPIEYNYKWRKGEEFPDDEKPPTPIQVHTAGDEDEEEGEPADPSPKKIYPEVSLYPILLMSREFVAVCKDAGVTNLQVFETKLVKPIGKNPPPKNKYLAVNIIGVYSPKAIDKNALIFRVAGGEDCVIVRHELKQKLDEAKLNLVWSEVKILPSIAKADGTITQLPMIILP